MEKRNEGNKEFMLYYLDDFFVEVTFCRQEQKIGFKVMGMFDEGMQRYWKKPVLIRDSDLKQHNFFNN